MPAPFATTLATAPNPERYMVQVESVRRSPRTSGPATETCWARDLGFDNVGDALAHQGKRERSTSARYRTLDTETDTVVLPFWMAS
jgi:hypothetical protein